KALVIISIPRLNRYRFSVIGFDLRPFCRLLDLALLLISLRVLVLAAEGQEQLEIGRWIGRLHLGRLAIFSFGLSPLSRRRKTVTLLNVVCCRDRLCGLQNRPNGKRRRYQNQNSDQNSENVVPTHSFLADRFGSNRQ